MAAPGLKNNAVEAGSFGGQRDTEGRKKKKGNAKELTSQPGKEYSQLRREVIGGEGISVRRERRDRGWARRDKEHSARSAKHEGGEGKIQMRTETLRER